MRHGCVGRLRIVRGERILVSCDPTCAQCLLSPRLGTCRTRGPPAERCSQVYVGWGGREGGVAEEGEGGVEGSVLVGGEEGEKSRAMGGGVDNMVGGGPTG